MRIVPTGPSLALVPTLEIQKQKITNMDMNICNSSPWETEAGGSQVQSQSELNSEALSQGKMKGKGANVRKKEGTSYPSTFHLRKVHLTEKCIEHYRTPLNPSTI